jgi:hypothetical protein
MVISRIEHSTVVESQERKKTALYMFAQHQPQVVCLFGKVHINVKIKICSDVYPEEGTHQKLFLNLMNALGNGGNL